MNDWQQRKRPFRLERRYEFESYDLTRDFLDRLGTKCEELNRFPDLSFGKKYVNITLRPEKEEEIISSEDFAFAKEIDQIFKP